MRRDLYGGLKNAIERGENIERAIQSFVNAGYSDIEVREAADQITPATVSLIKNKMPDSAEKQVSQQQTEFAPLTLYQSRPKNRLPILRIIFLIFPFVLLYFLT